MFCFINSYYDNSIFKRSTKINKYFHFNFFSYANKYKINYKKKFNIKNYKKFIALKRN